MQDQYAAEQFMDVVNRENEIKVEEQTERIQNLEQQLNTITQEASNDKGAADIIRMWIDSGAVAIGEDGRPNIIGNREDQQEEPM